MLRSRKYGKFEPIYDNLCGRVFSWILMATTRNNKVKPIYDKKSTKIE